jgi:hypothetical protein
MSVQNEKVAGQEEDQHATEKPDQGQQATEKPEPDEDDKKRAAEMMTAYEDRPTVVLPGSGGMITGTAVNDWLDDDGNPKYGDGEGSDDMKEQVEKDKAHNVELRKGAAEENKGEKKRAAR